MKTISKTIIFLLQASYKYLIQPIAYVLNYLFALVVALLIIILAYSYFNFNLNEDWPFLKKHKLTLVEQANQSTDYYDTIIDFKKPNAEGVLIIKIRGLIGEQPKVVNDWVAHKSLPIAMHLGLNNPTVNQLSAALDLASSDSKIVGVYIDARESEFASLSGANQFAKAVKKFKNSKKPVIALVDGLNYSQLLSLSTVDNRITSEESNSFLGMDAMGNVYRQGFYDKFKAANYTVTAGEYNTDFDAYLEDGITDKFKESIAPLEQRYQAIIAQSADNIGSKLDVADFSQEKIIEVNLENKDYNDFLKGLKVFNAIATLDKFENYLLSKFPSQDGKLHNYLVQNYIYDNQLDKIPTTKPNRSHIETFIVEGMMDNKDSYYSFNGSYLAEQLGDIANNAPRNKVKGVLIRVNSTGGSLDVAYSIMKAIDALKAKKIQVMVSVADYLTGASYLAFSTANKIVADQFSLVAGLGVGKLGLTNLHDYVKEKFALKPVFYNNTQLRTNSKATPIKLPLMDSNFDLREYSPLQKEYYQAQVDGAYSKLKYSVINNRRLSSSNSKLATNGLLYFGQRSLALGLVDNVGDYNDSLALLRKKVGNYPEFVVNGSYEKDYHLLSSIQHLLNEYQDNSFKQLNIKNNSVELSNNDDATDVVSICNICVLK